MATELGKAYVQIIPSAKGISGSISESLGGETEKAGKSAGLNLAGAIKGAIAAAGIGTAIKSALDAGGDLQQSFGGLETIYGEAAEAAKKYSTEAVKAGISANDYAEQAVSFGAALKQAYGGDTTKAMEAANTAILDMTDNAAKMGTPIENIQNAYQGFAKQNYTMLDNLKLGYGGTKQEMERLLEDATKLSGVEYDMSNLGDVYDAIHVIQEDLGLTGVAAKEASSTFTGSLAAMKAAGQRLGLGSVGAQTMRKTFAWKYYKNTGDIAYLTHLLNHASPSVTFRFIGEKPKVDTIAATMTPEENVRARRGLFEEGSGIIRMERIKDTMNLLEDEMENPGNDDAFYGRVEALLHSIEDLISDFYIDRAV
jgi:hypothetical protein